MEGREKKEGKGKWLDVGRRYSATAVLWEGTSRLPEKADGPVTFYKLLALRMFDSAGAELVVASGSRVQ